jgi:ferredoxin
VEVCPVDCFHEGENMLVINPAECIDCGVCVDECPAGAIFPENEDLIDWLELNEKYSKLWPVITQVKEPLLDADKFNGQAGKRRLYFSPKASI